MKKLMLNQTYSNNNLYEMFHCANSGGMRRSLYTNSLILIMSYNSKDYADNWEGKVLHYTGMGKAGNQNLESAQNKTLSESRENDVKLLLFETWETNKYVFSGEVLLIDSPHQQNQYDSKGHERVVWMFKLIKKHELTYLKDL